MVGISIFSAITFLFLVVFSSIVGLVFSANLPWTKTARTSWLPWVFGFALGPFFLGLGSVFVLWALPGQTHFVHFLTILLILSGAAGTILYWRGSVYSLFQFPSSSTRWSKLEYLLIALLLVGGTALVISSVYFPLTQNDSLEYAMVGRILFESGDLASYPAIHPEEATAGFYGPWTHPPLYVALVYLMYVAQGNAEAPGLIVLIAPWFALLGTAVVFALGNLVSRPAGLIAALTFLFTPLFFLGAGSALLDALPVLGFALILVVAIGVDRAVWWRGAIVGGAVGLALWTHSQAILFLPLALAALVLLVGLRAWRQLSVELSTLTAAALFVGGWPYLGNFFTYGIPITDNPVIFALGSLDWPRYFSVARGIDSSTAAVQYGLFKGWFALESFGWSFWLMSVGVVVAFCRTKVARIASMVMRGLRGWQLDEQIVWLSISLMVVYLMGVSLSIVLGIDLMIKNERYMLVMLPCVSVLAGYGVSSLCSPSVDAATASGSVKGVALHSVIFGFATVILLQFSVLTLYRLDYYGALQAAPDESSGNLLENFVEYQVMDFLRRETPQDSLILSLRPSDMYYADRKMISYLDPRLLGFYREEDPAKAAEQLEKLGVDYIHVPSYGLPVFYNSALMRVVRDPSLSSLEFSADGYQLYKLGLDDRDVVETAMGVVGPNGWTRHDKLLIGGRKALAAITYNTGFIGEGRISTSVMPLHLFHRDFTTALEGREITIDESVRKFAVDLGFRGDGFVKIWLAQYRGGEHHRQLLFIGDMVLTSPTYKMFSRRITVPEDVTSLRVVVEHVGNSYITIESAYLSKLTEKPQGLVSEPPL